MSVDYIIDLFTKRHYAQYRGYEWEKFGTFCERLLNKHPGAQLLKSDPTADQRFGNDQYIQCTAVTPEPDRSLPIFTSPDVPLAIRNYYEHRLVSSRQRALSLLMAGTAPSILSALHDK